ncbi:NTF2-like protein [Obba rivulosa]|uniref:NTF2-like protein n=1 Tax=Obba rivulosa TaxID=1052685 RepID=A0A8E2J6G8_9APHY|nr:NTF2-like protein [Obba rivulosa]
MTNLTRNDIEIATRAADHFTRLYYSTYDSATRVDDLPKFYRPSSALVWNGKPLQGSDGVRKLLGGMPTTKHDIQSFDCHPIPGSQPPSLMVIVSGTVVHGKGPAGNPPSTPSKSVDGQPRVFSQTFMLVPDPNAPKSTTGEVAKYYISADAVRFVG